MLTERIDVRKCLEHRTYAGQERVAIAGVLHLFFERAHVVEQVLELQHEVGEGRLWVSALGLADDA